MLVNGLPAAGSSRRQKLTDWINRIIEAGDAVLNPDVKAALTPANTDSIQRLEDKLTSAQIEVQARVFEQ